MTRKSWRVWCPSCNRPYGRHQWGRNGGKPIVCQHAALGSVMPRGISPRERGAWLRANACAGSLQRGRRVTDAEEAELALASPSAALVRALRAVGDSEVSLDDFARALYPEADRGRASRVGARGVTYGAQVRRTAAARLASLVRSGLASRRFEGKGSEASLRWRLLRAGWVTGRSVVVRAGGERWAHAPDGVEAPEGAWEREIAAIVRRTGRPHRDLLGAEAWPVEVEGAAGVVICGR